MTGSGCGVAEAVRCCAWTTGQAVSLYALARILLPERAAFRLGH